jgi:hypothetical protein
MNSAQHNATVMNGPLLETFSHTALAPHQLTRFVEIQTSEIKKYNRGKDKTSTPALLQKKFLLQSSKSPILMDSLSEAVHA